MKQNATLKQNFKRELLFQIIFNLRRKNIDMNRAQKIAIAFKSIMKSNFNNEEFLEEVLKLSKFYPEVNEAFISTVKDYEEITTKEKLMKVREVFMKGGLE